MVSSLSVLPEVKTERVDPTAAQRLLVGATSPLWLVFGGAAAAGATWWWWASRWREAVNLEAMLATTLERAAVASPEPEERVVEVVETVEAVAEPARVVAEAALETVVETVEAANDVVIETVESVADTLEPVVPTPVGSAPIVGAPVAETIETVAAAAKTVTDDLTTLVGIGPKLAVSLADLGVTRFSQIAAWSPEELNSIDQLLNLKGRADRDAWIAQAKRLTGVSEA